MEGFKGQKIPQIHVNELLLEDICFHKSIQDFSRLSSTTQKHNRNLEPFFSVRETSRFNFRREVFDISDQGPWISTTPRCLRLNESCWPKILYRKNYADKKGVNHSNNKERCSAGNLDDLLWKYCKSRYTDLSCSDVHWNFWGMCNALRLGSEVHNWYRLAISPIWRRRSTSV